MSRPRTGNEDVEQGAQIHLLSDEVEAPPGEQDERVPTCFRRHLWLWITLLAVGVLAGIAIPVGCIFLGRRDEQTTTPGNPSPTPGTGPPAGPPVEGPVQIFAMRHAESCKNANIPQWGGARDPPLTNDSQGHGRQMAFEGGRKFAATYPELMKKRQSFVFLVSPMRRTLETASEFIKGLVSDVSGTNGYGVKEDYMGASKIYLAPELRETAKGQTQPPYSSIPSDLGTSVTDWAKPDQDANVFSGETFFLGNDNTADEEQKKNYSWLQKRPSDQQIWPDERGGRYFGEEIGKNQNRSFENLLTSLKTDARFEKKIVFLVSHSNTMFNAFEHILRWDKKEMTRRAADPALNWYRTNAIWKQSVPLEVDMTTVKNGQKATATFSFAPDRYR
ncbi:unnamed protein product [Amoebophrya sp. A120]|nr:unnamed protein product [Amoebophrya sp. A120]|eukprot:GSA120T00011140001.1